MIEKKAGVYNPVGVHVGPTLQVFKSLNPDKPKSCQVFKRAEKNEKLAAPPKKTDYTYHSCHGENKRSE